MLHKLLEFIIKNTNEHCEEVLGASLQGSEVYEPQSPWTWGM